MKNKISKNVKVPLANDSFMWLVKTLILCIIINVISLNIGTVFGGIISLAILLVLINKINFSHSEEIDYYLYNITILTKKIICKNRFFEKLYNNSSTILKISVIICAINSLLITEISLLSYISGILELFNPYGILIGMFLCFVGQDMTSITKNMKLFYLFQIILLLREGVFNYFILSSKLTYISNHTIFTTFILWGISLYLSGCNFNFINKGENNKNDET